MKKNPIILLLLAIVLVLTSCQNDSPTVPEIQVTSIPIASESPPDPTNQLQAHFIDVGQGDSILLKQGTHAMLIDAGEVEFGGKVLNYLKDQEVESLEYVVATHPHSDHIGSMPIILNKIPVTNVYIPDVIHNTETNEKFLTAVEESKAKVIIPEPNNEFKLGEAKITVLSPKLREYENTNNYSIVLRVVYGKTSFLLTGDAMSEAEKEMLESGLPLKADILKVGHHGSNSSSTNGFLDTVNPTIAVITSGLNNEYDHPHDEVIRRLNKRDINIFRTDKSGNVVVVSDVTKLSVSVERDEQ